MEGGYRVRCLARMSKHDIKALGCLRITSLAHQIDCLLIDRPVESRFVLVRTLLVVRNGGQYTKRLGLHAEVVIHRCELHTGRSNHSNVLRAPPAHDATADLLGTSKVSSHVAGNRLREADPEPM